jgi:hypothetical protein
MRWLWWRRWLVAAGVLVLAGLVGLAPAVWGQGSSLVRPLAQVETGPERGAWVTHVLLAPTVLSDEAFDTVSATADAVGRDAAAIKFAARPGGCADGGEGADGGRGWRRRWRRRWSGCMGESRVQSPESGVRSQDVLLERFMRAGLAAGCPREQVGNFLAAGYVAQPKQLAFHGAARLCDAPGGPDQVGFGGARGPGKSHAVFAQVALDDCRRWPGLKVLYLRKALKQAREQFDDLRRRVLRGVVNEFNRSAGGGDAVG